MAQLLHFDNYTISFKAVCFKRMLQDEQVWAEFAFSELLATSCGLNAGVSQSDPSGWRSYLPLPAKIVNRKLVPAWPGLPLSVAMAGPELLVLMKKISFSIEMQSHKVYIRAGFRWMVSGAAVR